MKKLVLWSLCISSWAWAQDRADIDQTKIIGNRELPRVLTIVPWKKPLPGVLAGKPLQSVLDEALAPIDREVLRRQIDYGAQVQSQLNTPMQAKASTAPAQTQGAAASPATSESTATPAPANGEKR
jgi:hypothetical protein